MSLTIRLSCLAPPGLIVDDIRSEPNRLFQRFGFRVRRSALITAARRKLSRSRCCGGQRRDCFCSIATAWFREPSTRPQSSTPVRQVDAGVEPHILRTRMELIVSLLDRAAPRFMA